MLARFFVDSLMEVFVASAGYVTATPCLKNHSLHIPAIDHAARIGKEHRPRVLTQIDNSDGLAHDTS